MYDNLCPHFELVKHLRQAGKDKDFALFDQHGKQMFSHEVLTDWVERQLTVLSFEKEMGGIGAVEDEAHFTDRYYKEREWRLVPLVGTLGSLMKFDEIEKSYYYLFKRADVNMVVTPNDEMRITVLRFFLGLDGNPDERLSDFAKDPVPLMTYGDLHNW